MRLVLALALGMVLMFGLVATSFGDDKPVTLEGKITCAKCDLKVEGLKKCATVIVVKDKDKDVIYYFDEKGDKDNHKAICTEPKEGKVVGTVSEKDGKKFI